MPPSAHGRMRAGRRTILAIGIALGALLSPVAGVTTAPREAAAATVCGGEGSVPGIDVSRHQGPIDWPAVAASGIRFGIARIANGVTIKDAYFEANYSGMRANGIKPGSYIFWQPGHDPVAQANIVIAALARVGFDIGDIPPTIDVEVTGDLSPDVITARLRTTITTIQKAIGVTPLIYVSPKFWNTTLEGPDFSDVPLWIAHWQVGCPSVPGSWGSWSFWQTTSSGSIPGIVGRVDLNRTTGPAVPAYTGGPVLPMLPDINVFSDDPTRVTYTARAVGYRGIGLTPNCSPASGSEFPMGTTTVVCTAQNALGATARTFQVRVQRPRPPTFDRALPARIAFDADDPSGARATLPTVTATDFAGSPIPVRCSRGGVGDVFPIGESLVICRAKDSVGQEVAGSFTVSVAYRFQGLLRHEDPRQGRLDR